LPWFDVIVLAGLLLSAGFGFWQGATREMVGVIALVVAVVAAAYGLRFTGPPARHLIHPDWAGTVVAVVMTFILVYAGLRLVGAGLARSIKQTQVLGMLDRTIGLGFGLVRALVFLGLFNLAFTAATPPSLTPGWLTGSTFYPLSQTSGEILRRLAPKGMDMAGKLAPALTGAVRDGSAKPSRDLGGDRGYDARERSQVDDLVEKSR
jgi:membrane protein required for colicin V production